MTLILIGIFAALLILSMVGVLLFYIYIERKRDLEKGVRIYKYNQNTRLLQSKELKKFRHLYKFRKEEYSSELKRFDEELSFIINSTGEKLIRQTMHNLSKKPAKEILEFTAKLPDLKNNEFNIKMIFNKTEDDNFILLLRWNLVIKEKIDPRGLNIKKIDKHDMPSLESEYTGYVIFNIKREEAAEKRLIDIIGSFWNKELIYFLNAGMLVLAFQAQDAKEMTAKIEKFIKRFKERGIQQGARQLYSGSSYVYAKEGHTIEQQKKLLQVMEFFINISIDKNIDFVTPHKGEYANPEDHKLFLEGLEVFKTAILEQKIIVDFIPVKKYVSNKKVGQYVSPKIKGLNEHVLQTIMRNSNNKKALVNATASVVSKAKGMDPVLVDITANWLIKNQTEITNRKVIYVVDIDDQIEVEELRKTLESLSALKFMFGLRISSFSEKASILIKRCDIKFIVIDKTFIANGDLFDSNTYIDLLTISEFAEKSSIQILYEQPSEFIDNATANKIGLKYHF